MAGKGKNKARGVPTSGRRVVMVTNGGGAPERLTNTPATLNERFTQLARKTQGRDAQVQRGTTARYAATMAKRTGLSAKQFQVSAKPRHFFVPKPCHLERRHARSRPPFPRSGSDVPSPPSIRNRSVKKQTGPVAVAGKGKKSQQKAQAKGVAVGKKLKTVTVVRVTAKAPKATKATKATKTKKTKAPAAKADAKATKAAQPQQKTSEAKVKKPKATKKPKFVKPEVPKPEDLDKDLDSYMAAAPDPTLVA